MNNLELRKDELKFRLPELHALCHWDEDELLAYIVLKTPKKQSREVISSMTKDFLDELNKKYGLRDEILSYFRVEGGGVKYINKEVRDYAVPAAHTHLVVGKHKLLGNVKYPERASWKYFENSVIESAAIVGFVKKPWIEQYHAKLNGNLEHGAEFYNLKCLNGRYSSDGDDPVVISRMLLRKLKKITRES